MSQAMSEQISDFFKNCWTFLITKHNEGIYNTVCIVVLLMLPLLVFFTSLVICCHCCCSSFCRGCDCCCCREPSTQTGTHVEKKKKKTKRDGQNEEDLWISVKTDPTIPDRLAFTTV
ncbi:uncharacterized protein KIAA0040 homolog [Clarias gariepinus]|uniref:uncharacterized protein KIAA0040 homolog n=1 Tax=Clarias gariepinus TaxID=13013 RepID=UPI00234DF010|nr:uncharacterized protein KIAA0040 homolog [Clarias gariepinus]